MLFFNELMFLLHVGVVCGGLFGAARFGVNALTGLISCYAVLMNLFVVKQISLFGLEVTAADAYTVGISFGLNMLYEMAGRHAARHAVWVSMFVSIIAVVLGLVHLMYVPSIVDVSNDHFVAILHVTPRIVAASLFAYYVTTNVDIAWYGFLMTKVDHPLVRNVVSVGVTQIIDTVLFGFLGLYGIVSALGSVMVFSYLIKLMALVSSSLWMVLIRRFLVS